MICKRPINPITNPNSIYIHTQSRNIIYISIVVLHVAVTPVCGPWYALVLAGKHKLARATIIVCLQVYILHV
jgi:hypothetical protein